MEQFTNDAATTLTADITSTATTLTVSSSALFPTAGNFRIKIDSEIILVTAVSGTTWTITRGVEGTTGGPHTNTTAVDHVLTSGALLQLLSDYQIRDSIASIPTAARVGRIFRSTDSFLSAYDDGSAWHYYAFGYPVTPPVLSNFSWVNQGSSTTVTSQGTIYLSNPDIISSNDNVVILGQSLPSPPYTVTLGFIPNINANCTGPQGIALYNGSNIIIWGIQDAANNSTVVPLKLANYRFNSSTSFNSVGFGLYRNWTGPAYWFRIVDDNTNRIFKTSKDGYNWTNAFSETNTTFTTPASVGFFIDTFGPSTMSGFPSGINAFHWNVSTP